MLIRETKPCPEQSTAIEACTVGNQSTSNTELLSLLQCHSA
jgi:hypothetical protein